MSDLGGETTDTVRKDRSPDRLYETSSFLLRPVHRRRRRLSVVAGKRPVTGKIYRRGHPAGRKNLPPLSGAGAPWRASDAVSTLADRLWKPQPTSPLLINPPKTSLATTKKCD